MNKFRGDKSSIMLVVLCVVTWAIDLGILWGGSYL
ncbi:Uncharacterised protein [Serratia entomophila]|nr:Uncharacterised protein [Serratia entomophila]